MSRQRTSMRRTSSQCTFGMKWWIAPVLLVLIPALGSAEDESTGTTPPADDARREAILKHFHASEADFTEDGRIRIIYDFESEDQQLVSDWLPHPSETKRRIRWAKGYEGTYRTVEHGIVIADEGHWIHKARFLPEGLTIDVEYLSMSTCRPGDLLAALFFYDRGRRSVGSNAGQQCVRLKGARHAGAPIPREPATLTAEQRITFGTSIEKGGLVTSRLSGTTMADTSEDEKFARKLDSGCAGLLWRGLVNGFIFKITIQGTLDPDWVAEQLGEDDDRRRP